MSCLTPAFFTNHLPFYALCTTLWSKSHGLSCHHFPPSLPLIPLLFLVSHSLLLPSPNDHALVHTILPCMSSSFLLAHLASTCPHSCTTSTALLLLSHNTVLLRDTQVSKRLSFREFSSSHGCRNTLKMWAEYIPQTKHRAHTKGLQSTTKNHVPPTAWSLLMIFE